MEKLRLARESYYSGSIAELTDEQFLGYDAGWHVGGMVRDCHSVGVDFFARYYVFLVDLRKNAKLFLAKRPGDCFLTSDPDLADVAFKPLPGDPYVVVACQPLRTERTTLLLVVSKHAMDWARSKHKLTPRQFLEKYRRYLDTIESNWFNVRVPFDASFRNSSIWPPNTTTKDRLIGQKRGQNPKISNM